MRGQLDMSAFAFDSGSFGVYLRNGFDADPRGMLRLARDNWTGFEADPKKLSRGSDSSLLASQMDTIVGLDLILVTHPWCPIAGLTDKRLHNPMGLVQK